MFCLVFKRFLICILALSLSIGMLTSCSIRIPDSRFEKGNFVQQIGCFGIGAPIAASSKTDTFPIDNVSFELYYAFHEEGDTSGGGFYLNKCDHVLFALSIRVVDESGKYNYDFHEFGTPIDDYKNIPYQTYLYTITEDEAFSGKYSYRLAANKEFIYNHSETIKIPESIFKYEKGVFYIDLKCYNMYDDLSGYFDSFGFGLNFAFEKTDDNTVKLNFEKRKIYVPF